jgi:redox-sensitive bicupin YhaK (pirin superfamily)
MVEQQERADMLAVAGVREQRADGKAVAASLLILRGEPIDEPVVMHGPFVMNTANEIRQAIDDFKKGRFASIAA